MRLTQVLLDKRLTRLMQSNHNIYRIAKFKWELAKRKKVPFSLEYKKFTEEGYPLVDAVEYMNEIIENDIVKKQPEEVPVIEEFEKEIPLDENHPLYKAQPCYCLGDNSLLLKGVEQCKSLFNLVQVHDGLPESEEKRIGLSSIPFQDLRAERCIKYSHIFDAMQVKLPKRKDPARPAWVFSRDYGIDANRKFDLLASQFLQYCDYLPDDSIAINRSIVHNALCNAHVEKDGVPMQLQTCADILVTSKSPLSSLAARDSGKDIELPYLYPTSSTAAVPKEHFYHGHSIYPLSNQVKNPNPHTAIIHFNPQEVKNLYEEPVTDSQFAARSLTQSFTIAASRAQQLYGDDVKELPEPITIQIIQTDNKLFHFAILQLNTLNLSESAPQRNIFWMHPEFINLYTECAYVKGRPTLEGYNPEVLQRLLAFYSS